MPVIRRPPPGPPPQHQMLVQALAQELSHPTQTGPTVIEEQVRGLNRIHSTVIWAHWQGIDPVDRSAIILDAYEQALGTERMLQVSVALGLTPHEAQRLGVA